MTDSTKRTYVTAIDGSVATIKGDAKAVHVVEEALKAQGYVFDETLQTWHIGYYSK